METSIAILEPRELDAIVHDWTDLAAAALEPNPFLEPWFLSVAIRALEESAHPVQVFTVRVGRELAGMFPFISTFGCRGIPVRTLASFRHIYDALGTPLVHRAHALRVVDALLDWLPTRPEALFELSDASADGPFRAALVDTLGARDLPVFAIETHTRAVLRPGANAEAYLEQSLRGRKRKEYRRLARRLADHGRVEFRTICSGAEVRRFARDFLTLEASGWKGDCKTSLADSAVHRRFFEDVMYGAAEEGRLLGLALALDEKPIAMMCTFRSHDGYFAWKVAYDERAAKYSPGVLLEIENIRHLHTDGARPFMDSCASPDHALSNRLWPDRRILETVVLPCGPAQAGLASLLVRSLPLLQCTKRQARALLRRGQTNLVIAS